MRSERLSGIREGVLDLLRRLKVLLDAEVYLFGSYAEGTHTLESDVDIVVVSSAFEGLSLPERAALVRAYLPHHMSFDIIALTPGEFERGKGRAFYRHIARHWIRV